MQLMWRDKRWDMSPKKLNLADNLSMSMNFNRDEAKADKATVTLPYSAYAEFGVNPGDEIGYWRYMLGQEGYIYAGTNKLYGEKMKLVGVDCSEIKVTEDGTVRSVSISLSFEEV